jgi:hypothetical protein
MLTGCPCCIRNHAERDRDLSLIIRGGFPVNGGMKAYRCGGIIIKKMYTPKHNPSGFFR